jgi:hypothetical protein
MKRALALSVFLMLAAGILSAADVTGVWKGAFEYSGQSVPVTFNFKNDGGAVTGTVDGMPTPNAKIEEGKLDGEQISFWIAIDYQGMNLKLVYKGKIAGDQITFQFGTEDGSWGTEMTAKKSA